MPLSRFCAKRLTATYLAGYGTRRVHCGRIRFRECHEKRSARHTSCRAGRRVVARPFALRLTGRSGSSRRTVGCVSDAVRGVDGGAPTARRLVAVLGGRARGGVGG